MIETRKYIKRMEIFHFRGYVWDELTIITLARDSRSSKKIGDKYFKKERKK